MTVDARFHGFNGAQPSGCETVRQPWSERTESCECPQFARRERSYVRLTALSLRDDGALEGAGGALVRPRAHAW